GSAPGRPAPRGAGGACMGARMGIYAMLGLAPRQAPVISKAGGEGTQGAPRALAISQHEPGATGGILIHHTHVGMQTFTNKQFKKEMLAETGHKPHWATHAFTDVDADVRKSIAQVKQSPFLARTSSVRGFVFDVATGKLREVS